MRPGPGGSSGGGGAAGREERRHGVGVGQLLRFPNGAERRVPELPLPRRPRADVRVRQRMPGVARRHAVVDLVHRDAQIEVLGPQDGLLRRRERAHGPLAAGEPVEQHPGRGRVDGQLVVGAELGVLGVEVGGLPGLHPERRHDVTDRAAQREPPGAHDLGPLDPQRPHVLPEPARRHLQPDLPVLPVLRPGQQPLGHRVQRAAGRHQRVLVHPDLLVPTFGSRGPFVSRGAGRVTHRSRTRRATATTGTAPSAGSPPASPPTPPAVRAR